MKGQSASVISLASFLDLLFALRSDLLRFVRLILAVSAVALCRGAVKEPVYDGVWRGGSSSGTGGIRSSIVAVGQ